MKLMAVHFYTPAQVTVTSAVLKQLLDGNRKRSVYRTRSS